MEIGLPRGAGSEQRWMILLWWVAAVIIFACGTSVVRWCNDTAMVLGNVTAFDNIINVTWATAECEIQTNSGQVEFGQCGIELDNGDPTGVVDCDVEDDERILRCEPLDHADL